MVNSKYFNMGMVVVTNGINAKMNDNLKFIMEITNCLERYANKDWGNLDNEDKEANEDSLNYPDDLYLLGAYQTSQGKIWIITNRATEQPGDNVTTVLFPEER